MKRHTINDNLLYKRIGDVIYILDESNNQNVLFEFDNDGFRIMMIILEFKEFELSELRRRLISEYKYEEVDEGVIELFVAELVENGILIGI